MDPRLVIGEFLRRIGELDGALGIDHQEFETITCRVELHIEDDKEKEIAKQVEALKKEMDLKCQEVEFEVDLVPF